MNHWEELADLIADALLNPTRGEKALDSLRVADRLIEAGYRKYGRAQLEEAWDAGADSEFKRSVLKQQRDPNPYKASTDWPDIPRNPK